MAKPTVYMQIRAAMVRNEREVYWHIHKNRVSHTMGFGLSWMKALDRLIEKGRAKYNRRKHCYVAL
jgi:hypothetical protein